jgi:hypothetical protein
VENVRALRKDGNFFCETRIETAFPVQQILVCSLVMNLPLALLAFLTLTLSTHCQESQDQSPGKKDKPEKPPGEAAEKEDTGTEALQQALVNMANLRGYHIDAELRTPAGKASLSGDLGEGTISLTVTEVNGAKKKRIVADGEFFLSIDDGKTWKTGDEADKESTVMLSNIITAPIQMREQLVAGGGFTVKEVEIKEEKLLHVEKPAKEGGPGMQFWLCREPKLKDQLYVRKVILTVSATDMELPVTITYTSLAKPAEIKAPVKKEQK